MYPQKGKSASTLNIITGTYIVKFNVRLSVSITRQTELGQSQLIKQCSKYDAVVMIQGRQMHLRETTPTLRNKQGHVSLQTCTYVNYFIMKHMNSHNRRAKLK